MVCLASSGNPREAVSLPRKYSSLASSMVPYSVSVIAIRVKQVTHGEEFVRKYPSYRLASTRDSTILDSVSLCSPWQRRRQGCLFRTGELNRLNGLSGPLAEPSAANTCLAYRTIVTTGLRKWFAKNYGVCPPGGIFSMPSGKRAREYGNCRNGSIAIATVAN